MTTPLLRETKKSFSESEIDYLIGKQSAQSLKNNKNLNKIIKFEESIFTNKKIFKWFKLIKHIKKQNYNLVFVLDRHWIFKLTTKLAGIKKRIGFSRLGKENRFLTKSVIYNQKEHDILTYLKLLNDKTKNTKTEIFSSKEDKLFAKEFWKKNKLNKKKVIVICPGGAKNPAQDLSKKLWSTKKYIRLIEKLKKKNKIILIGGPSDKIVEKKILDKTKVLSLIGFTSIQESAEIMRKANLIICNDSGPMHIASAVNDNIVSLFGPTNPKVLAPLNKNAKYFWKLKKPIYDIHGRINNKNLDPVNLISVGEVLEEIK